MPGYDDADRPTYIEHQDNSATPVPLLRIEYDWNLDNTIGSRTEIEYDAIGQPLTTAGVTFAYDGRKRLKQETGFALRTIAVR